MTAQGVSNRFMRRRSIGKKLAIGVTGVLLVGLAVAVSFSQARQFNPGPRGGDLGLPNTPMGYLGIFTQEVNADRAKQLKLHAVRGVIVSDLVADSPAAKAGMKKGDVVTEYNGELVEGILQFGRLVRETPPGHTAQVSIWRDGHTHKLLVELGQARQAFAGPGPGRGPGPGPGQGP